MIAVRVPASTANLGPGVRRPRDGAHAARRAGPRRGRRCGAERPERAHVVEETHPAAVAFGAGGGRGRLWVRSPIPMGRGLGYSGAMRVGGLVARGRRSATGPDGWAARRPELLGLAADWRATPTTSPPRCTAASSPSPPTGPCGCRWRCRPRSSCGFRRRRRRPSGRARCWPRPVAFDAAVFNVGRTGAPRRRARRRRRRRAGEGDRGPAAPGRALRRHRPVARRWPPASRPARGAGGCRAAARRWRCCAPRRTATASPPPCRATPPSSASASMPRAPRVLSG